MVGLSLYVWFFHLLFFHVCYRVMSNTCYIFSLLFLFQCLSQVSTNVTFTSESSVIQLLFKSLPWDARKKYLCRLWNTNSRKYILTAYEQMFNWDTSSYSVSQFPNNFPDLTLFTCLVFSNDTWNLTALFCWQQSGAFEQWTSLECWKILSCSYQVKSTIPAILTLVIYRSNLCSFYWITWLC